MIALAFSVLRNEVKKEREREAAKQNSNQNYGFSVLRNEARKEREASGRSDWEAASGSNEHGFITPGRSTIEPYSPEKEQLRQRQKELKSQLSERENSGDMGGTTLLRREYDRTTNQLNALQKKYKDNFFGQFGANYTQGRLSQDSASAWNDYMTMPTEENRKKAETIDAILEQFQTRNYETLKDDATLPWLSQSLAGYLPQFFDQTRATASGGLVGAGVGSAVPVVGTLTGAKAGATAASGMYSYNTMRGSAFRDLLKLGFDEETARAAASDEAVVSAMIEMGDTLMDMSGLSFGAGSLIDVARKGLTKTLAKEGAETAAEKAAKKLLKSLGRYGLTVGGEMLEEGAQQAVSIANQKRLSEGGDSGVAALTGRSARVAWDALSGANTDARDEILEAGIEGGKIAAMMGGINAGFSAVGNRIVNGKQSTNPVENDVGKVEQPVTEKPVYQDEAPVQEDMQEDEDTAKIISQLADILYGNAPVSEESSVPNIRMRDTVSEPTLIEDEMQKPRYEYEPVMEAPQKAQEQTFEPVGADTTQPQKTAETAPHVPLSDLLDGGKRVDVKSLSEDHFAEWDQREDVWIDSKNQAYQMQPEQHISQRTPESVGSQKIHAFQFDHPELQPLYRQAAQDLIQDASASLSSPIDRKTVRGPQGKERISQAISSKPLRNAMNLDLTRNEIIKAAEDLIADNGQENYAAAKRLELVLDDMLTNGYMDVLGNQHQPNEAYLRMKQEIPGYQDNREELPIWDMDETTGRAVQSAYEAGLGGVPVSDIPKGADLAELDAYEAGRKESIRRAEKEAEAKKPVVEKQESEVYTEAKETAPEVSEPTEQSAISLTSTESSVSEPTEQAHEKPQEAPAKQDEETPAPVSESSESVAQNPQRAIADHLIKYISKGQDFNSGKLFELADKHYGGTQGEGKYTVKDAYDAMELAVNRYLISADFIKDANGNAAKAREVLSKLEELLKHLPTQTKRTEEMDMFQQFSTPPNIAYLAAWCANVSDSDVVLEPSAGIGGLALWPKAWGATVYGNELSTRRLAFLNELGLDGTFNLNAEQIDNLLPDNIKPSVVIMNPPFSSTAGRTSRNDTANAKRHIQQALDRLEDGGRLVAIVGRGMANDASAFKSWWNELREEYGIRANVRVDGRNYHKYGTDFDIQLVVIDKTGPQMGTTLTGEFKDLSLIPDFMEVIRNDRTRETGAKGVLRSGDPVSARDSAQRDGAGAVGGSERASGDSSDVRGRGKQGGKTGKRNSSERDGRADGRGDSGSDVRGVRGRSGDKEAVSSDTERTDGRGVEQPDVGVRMALSGRTQSDLDRKSSVKEAAENPDSVYATYSPKKVHIAGAKKHPARLVESAAMAAVDPPDVTYTPHLPARIAQEGILSDAQLENVVYAGQAHEQKLPDGQRKGYFIGDGTGVGKGRQISGIIMDNFMQGRKKAVWISASAELINDAKRDWKDLGGNPEDILNMKGNKLLKNGIQADSGILFGAYSTLASPTNKEKRFKMLRDWLGEDFDGVIALDEAHKMGNSVSVKTARGKSTPSQQALTGIELQKAFPNARIVYASATGATSVQQYGYLERLGLWGPGTAFNDLNDFISKINTGGLAAMELVARDMKAMGVYMARSISYDDVAYDTLQHNLTPMQTEIYDTMSRAWQTVYQNMQEALKVTGGDKNGQARSNVNGKFYSTQQRFYDQIITSMSMPTVIEDIRKELANGRSCVIQLVNTNEAQAKRAITKLEDEGLSLDDLDLTPSEMLADMVRTAYPVQEYEEYTDDKGNTRTRPVVDGEGKPVLSKKAVRMRDALLEDLHNMKVPDGPLEMLIDAFGVDNVAEVTGRTQRVVEKPDANGRMTRTIEKRNASAAGTADSKMFQDGKKRILVFSQAGGTGFSYHADLRAKNQQQRVHYLLQAGWSASDAVQGFGRTHRSNQASAPIVRLVTTNVMGQKRFTSTIARRLDQLGALTKGQRQAGSGVFNEKDNLENPISADALAAYYSKTIDRDVLKKLGLYDKLFDEFGQIKESAEELRKVSTFLNRILSLEVDEQNEVFQGFYDTFDRMMDVAIANGTVDMGLENYRADKIEVVDEKVVRKDKTGADTKYVQMKTYHKPEIISLAKVKKMHQNFQGLVRTEDGNVRAVFEISSKTDPKTGKIQRRFKLESPAKGKSSVFVEDTMKKQTKPIDKSEWADAWKEETAKVPEYNEGTLHLLTGTLLPIWDRLPANNTRVMRVISSDGQQFLGRVIRADEIDSVLKGLGANRTMQTFTPDQVSKAVLEQGKEVVFRDNRLRMTRRKVSGEWRMELTGQNVWYVRRDIPGVIYERIGYENRYFMPTGNKEALARLMELNPVVDIRDVAPTGDVDQRLVGGTVPDRSGEWTTKRVGDANVKPMRLAELVEKIHHDFEINITTGHIRGQGVAGQYSHTNHGIRSKIANDLPTIAHELGHHIDLLYGLQDSLSDAQTKELIDNLDAETAQKYSKDELKGEGIAEFLRRFLQNRETAAIDYPQFTPAFMNAMPQRMRDLVVDLADKMNAYYALDADTATSSIRLREEGAPDARTIKEKLKDHRDSFVQAMVDTNHGIKRFDRATGANTYKLATNAAYSDAMANRILEGYLSDADGQYVAPGLNTALHGLNQLDENEYRLFGEYLAVKHGPERLAEGMRIFADDRKNSTAFMERRQAELEAEFPQFTEISDRLYEFQRQFLQTWGVNTGLISQETADEWGKRWQYYVPLNRAVSEDKQGIGAKRGFADQNSTIHRAHGSGLDIIHPVDNIRNNIIKMVNAGVRNNVMRAITDQAASLGADARFVEQVEAPLEKRTFDMRGVKENLIDKVSESGIDANSLDVIEDIIKDMDDVLEQYGRRKANTKKDSVITVLKNGEPQFWKVNDKLMLKSLINMNPKTMNGILDAYAVVSRFMTSNITGNNVIWSLFSNAPMDAMRFFTYSKVKNPVKLFSSVGSAYLNQIKGDNADPLYMEYLAMGGGRTSAYTADRNLAKKARKASSETKISANPLDWICFVSDTVETGPRYATYKLMRESGMSPQEAFYESQDITTNFRRGGYLSREINKVVPFFNASVQGLDKFRRWIIAEELAGEAERRKVIMIRFTTFVAVNGALAALSYALNNSDEEKEKEYEQLSTFIKNSYWNIPLEDGKYFAIPKPRELAVLSSFIERCMEYNFGDNDHAFDEFYAYASESFLPNVVSDLAQLPVNGPLETLYGITGNLGIIGVVGYLSANRDFLGRPIVSNGLQGLEPRKQYTQRTSSIAYWIGQVFNASPVQIDFFFQQVLGGWWKYQKALFPVGEENRDLTLGVKNTYVKDNQYSTDLVNWLYDKAKQSRTAKNSDRENMSKAITAKTDEDMTEFYSCYYGLAKDKVDTTAHRATRQLVLDMIREYQKADDNGSLTPAQKAVYAVCKEEGSTEYLPGVMQITVKDGNDVKHKLSDVQFVEFQTDYLRLYWEYVEDNLGGAAYGEKAAVLAAAKKVAREKAINRTLARICKPQTKFETKYEGISDKDIVTFEAQKDLANDDGSLKQNEVIDILVAMVEAGLSLEDASALFRTEYDSDKNNPWRWYKP